MDAVPATPRKGRRPGAVPCRLLAGPVGGGSPGIEMRLDNAAVLKQLDEAIAVWTAARQRSKFDDLSDLKAAGLSEVVTVLAAAIERFAPLGTTYREKADLVTKQYGASSLPIQQAVLCGILKALRAAYAGGYLQTVQELVHADMFADFLEMAVYLLSEGYKDAAAVIGGSVLEENLRKLCIKNGVPVADTKSQPKKASVMNDDLVKAAVYTKLEQKSVTAWLDLRNKAAHGEFTTYDQKQVELYLQGIRDFLTRYPA